MKGQNLETQRVCITSQNFQVTDGIGALETKQKRCYWLIKV